MDNFFENTSLSNWDLLLKAKSEWLQISMPTAAFERANSSNKTKQW